MLITQREFVTRARSKSFIIITLLMPLLIVAMYVGPLMLSQIKDSEAKTVGVCDQTGLYMSDFVSTEQFRFVECGPADNDSQLIAKILITDTLSKSPSAIKLSFAGEPNIALSRYVEGVINARIYQDKIDNSGIEGIQQLLRDLNERVDIQTVKVDAQGQEESTSTTASVISSFLFTTLIFMFVTIYGAMVMQSVLEEKTSRIVEIMVSSVKPFQLMLGKILGIFLLGLLQISFWGLMYVVIMGVVSAMFPEGSAQHGIVESISATVNTLPMGEMVGMFLVYFVGGFLLFASIYAAVGASVNSMEEAQPFYMPIMLLMMFGFYAGIYSVENTDGPLAFWCSMIPITSPIVMMVRIPFGVPLWQELVSLAVLYVSALAVLWLGAKIYRIGILMYGKKPTIREIIKWISYK